MITNFSVELPRFPKQMYYLQDEHQYDSRVLVNVNRAEVHFPDGIAPQLFIHADAVDGSFSVSDDGSRFRQLNHQEVKL